MKKLLITSLCTAGIFSACSKKDYGVAPSIPTVVVIPSLKKDSTVPDRTIQAPKADTVLYSGIFDVGSANGLVVTGAKMNFSYSGAFTPADDLQNVYFVIKDGTTEVYRSEKKTTVANGENSFNQLSKNLLRTKSYSVEVRADVLSSATDGTGVDDQCTIGFYMIYQSGEVYGDQNTGWKTGQRIKFSNVPVNPSSTVQTSVDVSTPVSATITGSQEIELLRTKIKSTGGTSIIDEQAFLVSDVDASAVVSSIKVYDGATLVGTGSVSGQSAVVSMNVNVPDNTTKTFTVKAILGTITVNASSSNLKLTLDNVSYRDPSGTIKNNDTNRVGNSFVLLKAKQTITSIPLPGNLQNGVLKDGNKISILSEGGNTATKQLTYKITLTDNGTHLDTLSYKNLYLKVNGVTMTNVRFTNSSGQVIDSIGPGDAFVRVTFVTGDHEYVNPVGVAVEYVLGGRFTGFNHQSTDGDVGSIELVTTDTPLPSSAYKYVNSGVSPNNLSAKMWTSATASGGAVLRNYIWSDISAPGHSFAFGSGTGDAKDASVGVLFNTTPEVWLRQ